MASPLWVITGFKVETFDSSASFKKKILPDEVVGRLTETTQTIMHGGTTFLDKGKPVQYAYLNVYLQTMEEYESIPLGERGLGAVSGGCIFSDNTPFTGLSTHEQEWGAIDISAALELCTLYHSSFRTYHSVMVCFDKTNVAPISRFWLDGKSMTGSNVHCDRTDWGMDLTSRPNGGNVAPFLQKVTSLVVLKVDFPEVLEEAATKTVAPEVMFSELLTNGSPVTVKDTFNVKTTLLDTHTFVYEGGLEVDWSTGWKAKVPVVSAEQHAVEVEVSFVPHQAWATSKTLTVERSAEISLAPMMGCKATARYTKGVLAVKAVLTVRKTYASGAVQICRVPVEYTAVSCENAEIKLEGVPIVAHI